MSKELPYFRNTIQEWQNGKISTMTHSCKGLFWDICNYYWAQNCTVTESMLTEKFKSSSKTIQKLIKSEVIKDQNGIISITFLDEQLSDLNKDKSFFSEMGKKGQKAKKAKAPLDLTKPAPPKHKEKDKDKDNLLPPQEKPARKRNPYFDAIVDIFGICNITKTDGARIGKAATELKAKMPASANIVNETRRRLLNYKKLMPDISYHGPEGLLKYWNECNREKIQNGRHVPDFKPETVPDEDLPNEEERTQFLNELSKKTSGIGKV